MLPDVEASSTQRSPTIVKNNSASGNDYTPKDFVACGLLIVEADGVKASSNNLFDDERNLCNFGKGGGNFNPAP